MNWLPVPPDWRWVLVVLAVAGLLVWLIAEAITFWQRRFGGARSAPKRTSRMTIDLLIAAAVGVAALTGTFAILRLYDYRHTDISWSGLDRPLHHIGSRPANLYLVSHFEITGRSRRSGPILVKDAYLRSLVTGQELPIMVDRVPAKGAEIKGHATFRAFATFPDNAGARSIHGMTLESFWKQFPKFEFVFQTGRRTYTFDFGEDVTGRFLDDIDRMKRGAPGEAPRVLPPREGAAHVTR